MIVRLIPRPVAARLKNLMEGKTGQRRDGYDAQEATVDLQRRRHTELDSGTHGYQ